MGRIQLSLTLLGRQMPVCSEEMRPCLACKSLQPSFRLFTCKCIHSEATGSIDHKQPAESQTDAGFCIAAIACCVSSYLVSNQSVTACRACLDHSHLQSELPLLPPLGPPKSICFQAENFSSLTHPLKLGPVCKTLPVCDFCR